MAKIAQIDYFPTEAEIKKMLMSGDWQMLFSRDYSGVKQSVTSIIGATDKNTKDIAALDVRLTTAENKITVIIGRVDEIEIELDAHVSATSAHGASGNIVGTNNFCQSAVGGVVLLGAAVANASNPGASVPSGVGPAPAMYDQAYAQAQTDNINALINSVSEVATMANNALVTLNALLASLRAAKHIQP